MNVALVFLQQDMATGVIVKKKKRKENPLNWALVFLQQDIQWHALRKYNRKQFTE